MVDEIKIIDRIKNGDRYAMDMLIKTYYQSVFAYFYCHTGSREVSMDLTQEVFIKVITYIEGYKNKGRFKAWLFTVAANHLRNHWKHQRVHHTENELKGNMIYIDSDDMSEKLDLKQALLRIPHDQREPIILKYYYGFTTKEISEILAEKEPTIKGRIRYGLEKLKKILRGEPDGQSR